MWIGYRIPAAKEEAKPEKDENPCWDGYEMFGFKKKNGKSVPNCVKKADTETGTP